MAFPSPHLSCVLDWNTWQISRWIRTHIHLVLFLMSQIRALFTLICSFQTTFYRKYWRLQRDYNSDRRSWRQTADHWTTTSTVSCLIQQINHCTTTLAYSSIFLMICNSWILDLLVAGLAGQTNASIKCFWLLSAEMCLLCFRSHEKSKMFLFLFNEMAFVLSVGLHRSQHDLASPQLSEADQWTKKCLPKMPHTRAWTYT